jgi:hypothetical protein
MNHPFKVSSLAKRCMPLSIAVLAACGGNGADETSGTAQPALQTAYSASESIEFTPADMASLETAATTIVAEVARGLNVDALSPADHSYATAKPAAQQASEQDKAVIVELAFLPFVLGLPNNSAIQAFDFENPEPNQFVAPATICPDAGSAAVTLDGKPVTPGGQVPDSFKALRVEFSECRETFESFGTYQLDGVATLSRSVLRTGDKVLRKRVTNGDDLREQLLSSDGAAVQSGYLVNGGAVITSLEIGGDQTPEADDLLARDIHRFRSGSSVVFSGSQIAASDMQGGFREIARLVAGPDQSLNLASSLIPYDGISFEIAKERYSLRGSTLFECTTAEPIECKTSGQIIVERDGKRLGRVFYDDQGNQQVEVNGTVPPILGPSTSTQAALSELQKSSKPATRAARSGYRWRESR